MLWHPSLPASTASENLPGNPYGGGGLSGAARLLSSPPMGTRSAASPGVAESAALLCESSPSFVASPLQDASGMPRLPPPPPPPHRGGLKWRRTSWRGAAGGRRRRTAGQQPQRGSRRSWVGRGCGKEPMPAEQSLPLVRGSPSGKSRGRMAARRAANAAEDSRVAMEELRVESPASPRENMEITRADKEKCENDEAEEESEKVDEKEEEDEEEESMDGVEGAAEKVREREARRCTKGAAAELESGLTGAKKRKSNKVVKRELEPRMEPVVLEIVPDAAEEATEAEEGKAEEEESSPEEGRGDETRAQRTDEEDVRYVCPICEDVLSSQHLFTVHIRSHNDVRAGAPSDASATYSAGVAASTGGLKAFSCRICGKALSSSSSLDRHMLVHSGERPFKCRLCGVAFTTNGNMHRHMRTHAANSSAGKDPEEVSDCGSSDSGGSKKGKVTPKKSRTSTPATTPSPGSVRKRQANGGSVDPIKVQGKGNGGSPRRRAAKEAASDLGWRCLACDISFRNQRALRLHAYMAHRELEPEEEEEDDLEEEDCEEEEERGSGRKRSRRDGGETSSSGTMQTPTLGFQDLTFVDFSTQKFPLIARAACEKAVHRASSEFHRFHCGLCGRAFPCGSALHIHADSQHRAASASPAAAAPPTADDPKEDFFAVLNLQNKTRCGSSPPPPVQGSLPPAHLRLFPHPNSPSLSHLPYAERKRREEEFDNAFYFNSPAMKPKDLHAKKGTSEEEDDDREASEAPRDLADINSIISAVAGNASALMRSVEEDEEDELGGGYEEEEEEQEEEDATFAAELREMKTRGEFPCKMCSSIFPNLRALKGHSRSHISDIVDASPGEEEGAHRYPCCLCGRRVASDKHGLMRHLRSHNGERPYRCALCRFAFTTKANCERHLRNRHSKASREEIRRSVIYSPVADESSTGHPSAETEEKGRQELACVSQCIAAASSPVPTKLSALLTAITEPKSSLPPSDSFGMDADHKDCNLRMSSRECGNMEDLSSVEALVNFTKSPSLPPPLSMMSGQLSLSMQQHLFRPIAVKQELVKDSISSEAPLDLSMDALDLSSKKVQDEPEDLSRPAVEKSRPIIPGTAGPIGVGFNGGLLMPVRLPATPTARSMVPTASSENSPISQVSKMDPASVSLSNGSSRVDISATNPPSAPSFYPNPLQMYLNSQFPAASSARPPVGNFPYLLPLPFPSSSAPLISQLQTTQAQSPSLRPPPLPSPSISQPSHNVTPSYPGMSASTAPPSMERLEKEILRNLHLSSGGSLVLDAASVADRIQAIAMAAAAAAGFPPAPASSEHPPKSSQTKESKPSDPNIASMREVASSKEDHRMQPGVKMVIKNGVLMPKQKQRRYRTERPFACCHCSARFTLRSNMERHIKQQHPEFWSQRPRGGRRGGSSGLSGATSSRTDASPSAADARLSNSPDGPLPPAASLPAESAGKPISEDGCSEDYRDDDVNVEEGENNNMHSLPEDRVSIPESSTNLDDPNNKAKDSNKTVISEEVKNAIAQQLKSKLIADCRHVVSPLYGGEEAKRIDAKEEGKKTTKDFKGESNADDEEDSGELVIDEEKMDTENDCSAGKRRNSGCPVTKEDESSGVDLASVSKLLDNASTQTFQQYFKSEEDDEMEETDRRGGERGGGDEGYEGGEDGEDEEEEEGWKSGDETGGSKGTSSGEECSSRGGRGDDRDDSLERKLASVTVEAATAADTEDKGKRRSAYSSAPNRVSCPYCMRKFPWRSSLRRHILTHTGQKPYKCAHCPLLFTTKSNCDRHLLRKHGRGSGGAGGGCGGNSSGAEDAAPVVASSVGGVSPGGGGAASGAYTMRNVPERPYKCNVCPSSTFSTQNNLKKHLAAKHQNLQPPHQSHSGRSSTSPRGSSEKGGSASSASSPRCATEERDVDDEEDEEGLVGAEDEEGVLDEEEEEFEEEEFAEVSGGEAVCNGETKGTRSQGNSNRKREVTQPSSKNVERHSEHGNQNNRQLNGSVASSSADEGERGKAGDKSRSTPPPHQQNNQVHLHHQHHHHHHHHHPGSDLPFKCHLCERSYAERNDALNHIRDSHSSEYELLVAKGALDSAAAVPSEDSQNNNNHQGGANNNNIGGMEHVAGEENLEQLRGKFPDYANRKVVCAFCMRRFWSAEDLRRHMRTHTGERPFSCDICARRFTLKHSMLRHRKKHSPAERGNPLAVATSEASDEEAMATRQKSGDSITGHTNWEKLPGKDEEGKRRKLAPQQEIGLAAAARAIGGAAGAGDLIGNLLGIQDGSIIDKMLLSKSANDAAKLLGVEGHD